MTNQIDEFLTWRILDAKFGSVLYEGLDHLIENADEIGNVKLRNVCAKLSSQLADRLDNTVGLLDVSKRRFIEIALVDAMNRADELMKQHGLLEQFENIAVHDDDKVA